MICIVSLQARPTANGVCIFYLPFLYLLTNMTAFALFLQLLSGLVPDLNASSFSYSVLKQAMLQTIAMLNKFSKEAGVTEPSLLNFVVTDGHAVIATRYISSKTDEAASLYFRSVLTFLMGSQILIAIQHGNKFRRSPSWFWDVSNAEIRQERINHSDR